METSTFEQVIQFADKLGSLPAATIFALGAIIEAWYIWRVQKNAAISSEAWRLTRESAIHAEVNQTAALVGMTNQIKTLSEAIVSMSSKIDLNGVIIGERIPKR